MIVASAPGFAALAARLAGKARKIAEARAETRLMARRNDPARWRQARLLWPLTREG